MLIRRYIVTLAVISSHSTKAFRYNPQYMRNRAFISSTIQQRTRQQTNKQARTLSMMDKSDEEWKSVLTPNQFAVLRLKATEPSGFSEQSPGELEYELKENLGTKYPTFGSYECIACRTPLYTAKSKFDSSCGWPAFYEGVPGAVKELPDADGRRVEIVCNNCGSHLGHVFRGEGFPTPTDERHCVNGICLRYNPDKNV